MNGDNEPDANYDALLREVMRKPIPQEGFVLPQRPVDRLRHVDEDMDPYKRGLAEGVGTSTVARQVPGHRQEPAHLWGSWENDKDEN